MSWRDVDSDVQRTRLRERRLWLANAEDVAAWALLERRHRQRMNQRDRRDSAWTAWYERTPWQVPTDSALAS